VVLPLERPGARILINGEPLGGLVALEVQAPGPFMAGRFRAVFAMGDAPCLSISMYSKLGLVPTTLEVSTNSLSYTSLLKGFTENIRIDVRKNIAILSGRDITSMMIDSEISETFVNQTASEVAFIIATRHGLVPNITVTEQRVGQYYQIDHTRTGLNVGSRSTTEWNLLCRLADAEGFLVSVTDGVLNFGPASSSSIRTVTPDKFIDLDVDYLTALPKMVAVRSWNSSEKAAIQETAGSGPITNIVMPNMKSGLAKNTAVNYLSLMRQHQKILRGKMRGNTDLELGSNLMLTGTNSDLDDTYVVTSLRHRLNEHEGFVQMVQAYAVD